MQSRINTISSKDDMEEGIMEDKEEPKLYTKSKIILILSAMVFGASLNIFREWKNSGQISSGTLIGSAFALVVGVVLLLVIRRYSDKKSK